MSNKMNPELWPQQELRQQLASNRIHIDFSSATGDSSGGMVMGSTGPFAQYCGGQALRAGGNAMDAAVATSMAQITLCVGSWVSFAGIATLVVHDPQTGETHSINGPFRTFRDETQAATIPTAPTPSGRTALVPGYFAAMHAAHLRFGRLCWAEVLEPAIWLCDNGIPVSDGLRGMVGLRREMLQRLPETREVFFPNGTDPWVKDAWFKQPALGHTLRQVVAQGPAYLYEGEWADAFVRQVSAEGGKVCKEDLATYRAVEGQPLRARVYGHELRTVSAPDNGGAVLAEGLRLMEAMKIGDPLASGENLYWMAQILHQTAGNALFANEERVDDAHIAKVAQAMQAAGGAVRPSKLLAGSHSDYVVSADAQGMMVAVCHTINTAIWGTTGLNVGGISIPDAASFQQQVLAQLKPGDFLPNPMNPTLVFRDGRAILACSSVGSGLMSVTLQSVHAMLGLGMDVKQAVQRPRLHGSNLQSGDSVISGAAESKGKSKGPVSLTERIGETYQKIQARGCDPRDLTLEFLLMLPLCIEDSVDAEVIKAAQARGALLDAMPISERTMSRGFWGGIERDPDSGRLKGGRTPGASGQIIAV
jgi:gamma-glutamyltranspeptidase / glutathione hydrolase